jgi:transposase
MRRPVLVPQYRYRNIGLQLKPGLEAQKGLAMTKRIMKLLPISIGLDLGDRKSRYCIMSDTEEILEEGSVKTTRDAVKLLFSRRQRARVVIEAGTHSAWVSSVIQACGHKVLVANPRVIGRHYLSKTKKNDKTDARVLAHLGHVSEVFLAPIKHRDRDCQVDLAVIRSRDALIKTRTQLINHVRSIVKIFGERLPSCTADAFSWKVLPDIPADLTEALIPLVEQIGAATQKIKAYNKKVEELCATKYPETKALRQIPGVGPLTALAFVLTLEDPARFDKSRKVGAFLGLVPRQHESGLHAPQLRITKAGNEHLRRLLVSSAQYILGHYGDDCDLRRHGERISAKGGKAAKKRAVVAVARKLSVVLHTLWRTGAVYEPFYSSNQRKKAS